MLWIINDGKIFSYDNIPRGYLACVDQKDSLIGPAEIKPLVAAEIKRLVAEGKMDIKIDIQVNFSGDRRALKDIAALAKANYGEDEEGNNVELPSQIDYLRK
jgi:hypothetical protein